VKYVKPTRVNLATHSEFNERWVQARIAEDPSLLGLGDLVVKDKERIQPRAGRLDLLCQEADSSRRYEIEIQLGRTDESHLIRTLEYWDIEKKRYPQYDHTAVIVAEDITSRFLNVISLFNGAIPIIALQMQAFQIGDQVLIVFTKVLDETRLGLVDEDEEVQETTDRGYWEKRGTQTTVAMVDSLLGMVQGLDPTLALKYNKFYIGLAKDGQPTNFVIFRPKKEWLGVNFRIEKPDDLQEKLDEAGLDAMDYDSKWGRYRLRLTKDDLAKHTDLVRLLARLSRSCSGRKSTGASFSGSPYWSASPAALCV